MSQGSYLVADPRSRQAVVIDPRRDVECYLDSARARGLTIVGVLMTHFQADFVAGHLELAAATGACRGPIADDEFDVVVHCTGPRPFASAGWNPVVDSLLTSGLTTPDAHGIGLAVSEVGELLRAPAMPPQGPAEGTAAASATAVALVSDGYTAAFYAVGPARRGSQWESTAIPEIRADATRLTRRLRTASDIPRPVAT
ncbi:hypothetical protein [Rarobacter faecitabidus]|uniref:hypothetical protein n=1 Tax=Rarobacter faecitabidus TaxID=13243 RepID=UPI001B8743E1|nr:hypothetical protein [Rarobacter faecitabidus]